MITDDLLFDLDLSGSEDLSEDERMVLLRLLAVGVISEEQANEALRIHRLHRTPLLDILGSLGYIRPSDYASSMALVSGMAYGGDLFGTEYLAVDHDFLRRFDPVEMMRLLCCPISALDESVIVLAVYPQREAEMTAFVRQIVPNADLILMVGTEVNVTRLIDSVFQSSLSFRAVNELRRNRPVESASQVMTVPQILIAGVASFAIVTSLILWPQPTLTLIVSSMSMFYTASILYKLIISIMGSREERHVRISARDVADVRNDDLPIYSILVPVYKEPEVVPTLLAALGRMDYPSEKLDVLLLMEEDDTTTIEAARNAKPPSFFRFIYIPPSQPRTKPKACNYGLTFCRGEYITIYDAEDIPEPDQLKKAILAFRNGPENLVCVQAALNYFNSAENYLTRMFTLEYSYWFDYMLPGLDRLALPIPLGGTSNHFRADRLRELGGWDPFNVTEDADLGIRSSARGYTVGIINSTTYEEANKAFKNWIRQRSRWIKGYMQTWLVHNRHPLRLLRSIGLKSWLSYQFFIGGTCLTFLANPIMWLLFIVWLVVRPAWISEIFAGWVLYLSAANFLVGNMLGIYLNMLAVFQRRLFHLTPFALTNPIYWWMHSAASYMALWQLFTKPFYWEKTTHGLTNVHSHSVLATQSILPPGKAIHG